MKKKILAAALASVMALTNVSTLFAAEESGAISGDLTVTGFLGDRTDSVELKNGDSWTLNFNNKSNGETNWDNFILFVTGVPADEYDNVSGADLALAIRADNWGWGGGLSDFALPNAEEGNKLVFESNIDFGNWGAQEGFDVEATISKNGNTLTYNAKIGDYYAKLTATSGKDLPENLYVFLSGENCELTGITATKNNAGNEEPEIPEGTTDLGNLTLTGFLSDRTTAVELKDGESWTLNFNNKSNGETNWDNFILFVTGVPADEYDNVSGADLALAIRADNWGWGGGLSDFALPNAEEGNKLVFESNIDFGNWGAQEGFDVEATISKNGNTLTYNAKIGDYYAKLTATSGKDLPKSLYVFLTGENCVLSGITATKSSEGSDEPDEPDVPEIPEGSTYLGNLTVTTFFNEKTDFTQLKSGESLTLKFNNKSNGTLNWENFVLVVTGEESEAGKSRAAEQEVLVIRADSWGWGGGLSDISAPDGTTNVLVFENNVDWDNWVAGARAGYDVELTVSRYENTIAYDAKIGDYYVKTAITSGKDLPENLYVFLTGENCVLSQIIATKGDGVHLDAVEPVNKEPEPTTTPTGSFGVPATPAESAELGDTNTISNDLTVTSFFAEKTEAVTLTSGGSYTFKFRNKSNGTNNWDNFVMAVTGEIGSAYKGADQEILVIRADSWGWGGGYSDFVAPDQAGNALVFDTNIDWDKWQTGARAGYDVELTISRDGNTLTYDAKIGDYYVKLKATSGKTLPKNTYVFFTGENCVLTGITTINNNPAALENTAAPEETKAPAETAASNETAASTEPTTVNLGDLTVTGFFVERTNAVELKNGGSYTFKFNNKSNGTNNWENFVLAVTGETGEKYTGADQEILVIRADNWGWGGGYSDFVAPDQAGNALVFDTNIDWDNWVAGAKAGYDVEITIGKNGNTLTYDAKIGDYYVKLTATSGKALPESAYVFFTGENCVLSGITATDNNPTVSENTASAPQDTSSVPQATTAAQDTAAPAETAKSAAPISLGNLTVTNFFNEKTGIVKLKSGDSYSFKFNNKSNGTNNWDNFILAIAGETGAAYTGADQEVLIIRADNWGWGGGYSDFVSPDQAGNALVFDTNIDWDKWVAGAQAGYDVNITLTRSGNTLKYYAAIGDYYVKLTATSGKKLPETLYVFLTGENCVLSGITATALTDSSPNTGIAAPCAVTVVAIASAAAIVVLKKKSAK